MTGDYENVSGTPEADAPKDPAADSSEEPRKPRIDWADPSVPVGNAPPLPRWPLTVSVIAWLAWVAFLVTMLATNG